MTIETDDASRYIRSGMELPVFIRDGKHRERYVITVQRCSCAAPNDGTKCDSLRAAAVPINAQVRIVPYDLFLSSKLGTQPNNTYIIVDILGRPNRSLFLIADHNWIHLLATVDIKKEPKVSL